MHEVALLNAEGRTEAEEQKQHMVKGHQNIITRHSASESCAEFDVCADSVYQALLSTPTFREPGYEATGRYALLSFTFSN